MSFATYTLGRSRIADIALADPSVSRQHLELKLGSDLRLFAINVNSSTGTRQAAPAPRANPTL